MICLPRHFFFTRLLLTLGLVSTVLCLILVCRARHTLENLGERALPGIEAAADIKRIPDLLYSTLLQAALTPAGGEREALLSECRTIAGAATPLFAQYRTTIVVPADLRRLEAVEAAFKNFDAAALEYVSECARSPSAIATLRFAFRRFDKAAHELYRFRTDRAEMWVDRSVADAQFAIGVSLVTMAVLGAVFLAILLRLAAKRVVPLDPENF